MDIWVDFISDYCESSYNNSKDTDKSFTADFIFFGQTPELGWLGQWLTYFQISEESLYCPP